MQKFYFMALLLGFANAAMACPPAQYACNGRCIPGFAECVPATPPSCPTQVSFAAAQVADASQSSSFTCSYCSTGNNAGKCDIQSQADQACQSAGFSNATIVNQTLTNSFKGGFCFDGQSGGRVVGFTYATNYNCN